jgi:hypothetical protein
MLDGTVIRNRDTRPVNGAMQDLPFGSALRDARRACVFLLVLAFGCLNHQTLTQDQLVGNWKGAAYQSQFGASVNTLCFRSDGTVESVIETQAGPVIATGTYSLSGDKLTLKIADAVENAKVATVRLSAGELTIVDGGHQTVYDRISASCPSRP